MVNWRLAALGVMAGMIAGGISLVWEHGYRLVAFSIVPGLVFGVIVGGALWWGQRLTVARWLLYIVAAGLANAVAVWLAAFSVVLASRLFSNWSGGMVLVGLGAGAIGSLLLGLASEELIGARRWGRAVGAGALLGALLPVAMTRGSVGTVVFYALWQAGYAAFMPTSHENGQR